MSAIPPAICQFFHSHHVTALAASLNGKVWSASCFYVFEAESARLIVLSSRHTQHGSMMVANPQISGTVAGQPRNIHEIRGIQFSAQAMLLGEPLARQAAFETFCAAHPAAAAMPEADVWAMMLDSIKFTDNSIGFGHKTLWTRPPESNQIADHRDWFVYLIECANGALYCGITKTPQQRFHAHARGKGAKYTRTHKPLAMRIIACCLTQNEALKQERAIKKMATTRKQKLWQTGHEPKE